MAIIDKGAVTRLLPLMRVCVWAERGVNVDTSRPIREQRWRCEIVAHQPIGAEIGVKMRLATNGEYSPGRGIALPLLCQDFCVYLIPVMD